MRVTDCNTYRALINSMKPSATHCGITSHQDWRWTLDYANANENHSKLVRAFQTAVAKERKYKFGVKVPKSIAHALYLDHANVDNLWHEVIEKELKQLNDYQMFHRLNSQDSLDNYTHIPYHIVFDVKFDLQQKARLVARGNHTDLPKEDIFSGIAGMESIQLGFLLATMNGLDTCAADIGNAFLYGHTKEKVYIIAGKEFAWKCSWRTIDHRQRIILPMILQCMIS